MDTHQSDRAHAPMLEMDNSTPRTLHQIGFRKVSHSEKAIAAIGIAKTDAKKSSGQFENSWRSNADRQMSSETTVQDTTKATEASVNAEVRVESRI